MRQDNPFAPPSCARKTTSARKRWRGKCSKEVEPFFLSLSLSSTEWAMELPRSEKRKKGRRADGWERRGRGRLVRLPLLQL